MAFSYLTLSVYGCAVPDDQMIGPFIFEVPVRRVPSNWGGGTAPTFGRCACE